MKAVGLFASLLPLVVFAACTASSSGQPLAPAAAPSGPPDPSKLPPASADALGQDCSGFGTGLGETALFDDADCGAGACLVDTRTGIDLYCSADCTKVACPSGYTCGEVDHPHGGYACFRDEKARDDAPSAADAGADAGLLPTPTNPDGVLYPLDHIGWNARSGSTRGERIANLAFVGYAPQSTKTKTVSLADFYDPNGARHDAVLLIGGSRWDSFTGASLSAAHAATTRVAVLAVIGEGTAPGAVATATDLGVFRGKSPWATTALDAGFALLKPAFDADAVPLTMLIDARTMEIVESGVGAITVASEIDDRVNAVTSRPPAY